MAWKMYPKYGLTVDELKTKGVIYKITFYTKDGEKYYIGQTNQTLNVRLKGHIVDSVENKTPIHRAILKYNLENCKVEIIDKSELKHCLNLKEIYWIKYFNSFVGSDGSNGYNCSEGGGGILGYKRPKHLLKNVSGENSVASTITNKQVYEVKKLIYEGKTPIETSNCTNVPIHIVYSIRALRSWESIASEFNEHISKLTYKNENLSDKEVEYIKIRLSEGESVKNLILELGLDSGKISRIRNIESFHDVRQDLNEKILKYVRKTNPIDSDTVYKIKYDLCEGLLEKDISKKYNIPKEKIGRIKTLTLHTNKHPQFNEKLKTLNKRVV